MSSLIKLAKGLLIGDTIFTTLRWTETFHMTDTLTRNNRYVSELQLLSVNKSLTFVFIGGSIFLLHDTDEPW